MDGDDEGHGQVDDVFHCILEELFHFILFPGRDFQDQFVMDLDQELALQVALFQFVLDSVHGQLDDIGRTALDRRVHGRPFGKDYFDELLERIREIRASERRAYQKIADVFEQCSYDYDKNSETTKAFYAFVQNKLHYAVTGMTAAELISERATLDSPTMGLTTWKGAPDGKILKSDTLVAKNYLNEKELAHLNRLVTMFIDYAELMAEDEQLMSMQDWLDETDRFLTNNRRKVLDSKGHISRETAAKKVGAIYEEFRKKQDAEYISEFDREMAKYLKGGEPD